jgi:hypothetical protein
VPTRASAAVLSRDSCDGGGGGGGGDDACDGRNDLTLFCIAGGAFLDFRHHTLSGAGCAAAPSLPSLDLDKSWLLRTSPAPPPPHTAWSALSGSRCQRMNGSGRPTHPPSPIGSPCTPCLRHGDPMHAQKQLAVSLSGCCMCGLAGWLAGCCRGGWVRAHLLPGDMLHLSEGAPYRFVLPTVGR